MHTLNQRPLYGALSLIRRIHGSKNQGVEAGEALSNIICNDPSGNFVLSVPTTLGSAGLEVLVPQGDIPLQRDIARLPLIYKTQLPSGYFRLLISKTIMQERESLP